MKLLRLKLNSDFRSLKTGFEISFRDITDIEGMQEFQPFCFAGLNGSGKSNVLEALANIFYHLDLCANRFKPDAFKSFFNPATNINGPDAFELEYLIFKKDLKDIWDGYNIIRITKQKNSNPTMFLKFVLEAEDTKEEKIPIIATNFDKAAPGKFYLPDLVVGYSSGENEILSIPFIKSRLIHFDEYAQSSVRGGGIGEEFTKTESSLIYIDKEMSQAVLLACLIFENEETLKPLKEELGIQRLRSFRMQLSNQLLQVVDDRKITRKLPVLSHLNDKIQLLKKLATSHFEKLYLTKEIEEEDITFEYTSLTLDFFIDDSMKKGFKDMFSSSLDMFQFFQLLYELNNNFLETSNRDGGIKTEVYKSAGFYTDGKLPVPGPNDRVFFFLDFLIEKQINGCKETKDLLLREFSDGEHQFLHTMCICLLLKDKRTILLLDEPETHFNPDWRSKFINVLGKSLKAGGSTNLMKDILLTSHSPFIISDCLPNNVFVFRKEANELIVKKAKELNFNTYGASVDLVLQVIFQMDYSISKTALEEIRVLLRKRKPSLIVEGAKKLGESYEKGFLYERIEKLKSRNNN